MSLNLAQHLETALGQAAGRHDGQRPSPSRQLDSVADLPALEEPIVWQQSFSAADGPSFWIVAGRDIWESLGRAGF